MENDSSKVTVTFFVIFCSYFLNSLKLFLENIKELHYFSNPFLSPNTPKYHSLFFFFKFMTCSVSRLMLVYKSSKQKTYDLIIIGMHFTAEVNFSCCQHSFGAFRSLCKVETSRNPPTLLLPHLHYMTIVLVLIASHLDIHADESVTYL